MAKINLSKEKKDITKWHKIVYTFIYICIAISLLGVNKYTDSLDFLDKSNTVFINPKEFNEDFSVYELKNGDDYIFNYTISIPDEVYKNLDGEEYRLIINGVHDNAIKVWFNNQLVISVGDSENGLSMLRSAHVYGSIERSMIESNNLIKIQTYANNRTGTDNPIIFTEKAPGERAIRLLVLFNERLIAIVIGFIIMSVVFVLIIYTLNKQGNKLLLFLSLATLFIGIYFFDYLPVNYLNQEYIILKKIFLFNLSLGILFYGISLYTLIQKKYIIVLSLAQLVYYIVIILLSRDIVQFRFYYNYYYFSLLPIVLIFFMSTLFNIRKSSRLFILLLHFSAIFALGLVRFGIGFKNNYFSLAMPIFIMFTVGFLPMIITFDLLLEKDLKVIREKELKDVAYKQSMTDDLTGVWNKRYLESRLDNLHEKTVVALIDLDNLKAINDTHGHLAGDAALYHIIQVIKNNIRQSDDICRYGGDEFVVIFEDCRIEDAVDIIEKIRKSICKKPIVFNEKQLTTSISTGLCAVSEELMGKKILECADRQLYIAKAKGKNRTEFSHFT